MFSFKGAKDASSGILSISFSEEKKYLKNPSQFYNHLIVLPVPVRTFAKPSAFLIFNDFIVNI